MKKRHFINRSKLSDQMSFNPNVGLKHALLREESLVDEFYLEECASSDDKKPSFSVVDPLYTLFNQQRLDNLGAAAVKNYLDSLVPKSNELAELRQKCSDEDLMKMVKSRHLQAPCEILAWCRYMQQNISEFESEVAKLMAEKEIQDNPDNVEPNSDES